MNSKSSDKATVKVAIIAKSPIIAPHPAEPDIYKAMKPMIERYYTANLNNKDKEKMLEKIEHIDRVFLRNDRGEPIVNGGFLKGYVNRYALENGIKVPQVSVSEGKIEGNIVILPMRRKTELTNPEVLLPPGKIIFEIKGKPNDIKEFIRIASKASQTQPIGGCGNRGFGRIEVLVIQ